MTDRPTPGFTEASFNALAAALDRVASGQHALFLTKLVILLAAGHPQPAALDDAIRRAQANLQVAQP